MTDFSAKPALVLEVIWADNHMLELRLAAGNENFSGRANFYANLDEPKRFAALIEGFPHSPSDVREYEFGTTTMAGYGGVKLRFVCQGGRGHVAVQITVYSNPIEGKTFAESTAAQIEVVPSDIDSFVCSLRSMACQVGAVAVLRHTT